MYVRGNSRKSGGKSGGNRVEKEIGRKSRDTIPVTDTHANETQKTNNVSPDFALLVWTLGDNQNTVRDLATYNSGANTTTVVRPSGLIELFFFCT